MLTVAQWRHSWQKEGSLYRPPAIHFCEERETTQVVQGRRDREHFRYHLEVPAERIASAVIINLDELYRLGVIEASLASQPETEFIHGIRNLGNREREVIAGPITVTADDVYAIRLAMSLPPAAFKNIT